MKDQIFACRRYQIPDGTLILEPDALALVVSSYLVTLMTLSTYSISNQVSFLGADEGSWEGWHLASLRLMS